ncbi:hypothetical protein XENORESO_005197, partial [Xenotaenia resolanae]
MEPCEDRDGGVPRSKTTLCMEHEGQRSNAERDCDPKMKLDPSVLSQLSARKRKEQEPEPEPSCLSMKSNQSKPDYINFKLGQPSDAKRFKQSSEVGQSPHERPMELGFIFM